jgi:hypothetical protein
MWTLTPDNLAQARSELQGRRAAIEARYAAELKAIDADLEEIETLERVAHSFSVKHLPGSNVVLSDPGPGEQTPEPVATALEGDVVVSELEAAAGLTPEAAEPEPVAPMADSTAAPPNGHAIAELERLPEEPAMSPETVQKGGSLRWRIRIPSDREIA